MCIDQASTIKGPVLEISSMSPTQLLGLAIKKRRELMGNKERNYRRELLQTSFIQSLCKHLGERRARRRRRFDKSCSDSVSENHMSNVESPAAVSQTRVEPVLQTLEPSVKRSRTVVAEDEDPFGLEEFFATVSSARRGKSGEVRS